ncbi:atrial natriuretic peptide-converting enzyme-like [Mytilus californianus]|uniref:atrial natriuretic peptide-converting enzyme-like n=1 Tax=Mytilus californianus TaxID=6549 RepID=UPI00224842D5|nr:atrial natriuretic peptide-converting enzyme-like [Mytilus californianus]
MKYLLLTLFVYGVCTLFSTSATTCNDRYVKCKDGIECVYHKFLCDGGYDCGDKSDEDDCKVTKCTGGFVKCKDGIQCVFHRFVCDGDYDCRDRSDEDDCKETKRSFSDFLDYRKMERRLQN